LSRFAAQAAAGPSFLSWATKRKQKAPLTAPVKNRFGVCFVSAASISLKNAKNSPALKQFRIFAARGSPREAL